MAYALGATIRGGDDASNSTAILAAIRQVEFDGASGEVMFDANLDRRSSYDIVAHGGDNFGAFSLQYTATQFAERSFQRAICSII